VTTLFLGFEQGLMRVEVNGTGTAEWVFRGPPAFSVAIDPKDAKYVYATTIGGGVIRSEDGGRTFQPGGEGIFTPLTWASSVSPTERTNDGGVVYVGTMPSMMFRSEDGGRTFRHLQSFDGLENLKEAAFPPTPATHMIHMIATSFNRKGTVMAGIELGGVVRSNDGGETWEETPGGPDCHQLLFHPLAPDRVYESDGGGPFESKDNGDSWVRDYEGIPDDLSYFYDMAVDPGDPDTQMVSVGRNQYQAHGINPYSFKKGVYQGAFDRSDVLSGTYSTLFRRRGNAPWEEMREGLPAPEGHDQGRFATALGDDKGTVYYVTIPGDVYHTTDGGDSWTQIDVEYPADAGDRMLHVARAVKE
jgi:photosystem II stability/assembly factor-like uncharacterized protein